MNNNSNFFISKFRSVFFSVALVFFLASCMDDDDTFVSEPLEVAYVSVYHAVPDGPQFDIVVDDRVINRNPFDYASYSGYLNFFTGNRSIKFTAAGASNALIDTTFNFADGKAYSLFAINSLPRTEALLVVDSAAAPQAGKARVRFIHLSPDAPAFDVTISGDTAALFTHQTFKDATEFKEIDAGVYSFDIADTGSSAVTLSAKDVQIVAGRFYTILTRGFANPPQGNTHGLSVEVLD